MADYALSAAEKAQRENRDLQQRVTALEVQLMKLTKVLLDRCHITINDARATLGLPAFDFTGDGPAREPEITTAP
jgi:hypothetical protein